MSGNKTTTALTDDARAEMRKAAEAATPGLWHRTGAPWFLAEDGVLAGSPDGNVGFVIADCDCFSSRDEYEGDIQLSRPEDDAAHIVAACPANVLALLDHCDRLERERDEARELVNHGLTSAAAEADRWQMAHSLSQRALETVRERQRETLAILARVVEIAGRNEAAPEIDQARRLLAEQRGFAA